MLFAHSLRGIEAAPFYAAIEQKSPVRAGGAVGPKMDYGFVSLWLAADRAVTYGVMVD
jgi:hypothetical protein